MKEYAPTLIKRTKLKQKEETIEKHVLVWILEDFTARGICTLGIIVETFTGPDGIAPSCLIKTALGTLTRPAMKLALVEPKTDL